MPRTGKRRRVYVRVPSKRRRASPVRRRPSRQKPLPVVVPIFSPQPPLFDRVPERPLPPRPVRPVNRHNGIRIQAPNFGQIGQPIIAGPPKARTSATLIPVRNLDRGACQATFRTYKQGRLLGKGAVGKVVELCNAQRECPYVLKVQSVQPQFMYEYLNEVKTQIIVHELFGFTPAIYDYWFCNTTSKHPQLYIVMERLDGTLHDYVVQHPVTLEFMRLFSRDIRRMLDRIHSVKIAHQDVHPGNIMFKQRPNGSVEWYLNDWGWSDRDPFTIGRRTDDILFKQTMDFLRRQGNLRQHYRPLYRQ